MIRKTEAQRRRPSAVIIYDASTIILVAVLVLAALFYGGDPEAARERRAAFQRGVDNALGGLGTPQLIAQFDGIDDDPEVNERMQALFAPLAERAKEIRPDLRYSVSVLRSDVPNAFSLPGGRTFITRGLIDLLETDDEIAGVMGHELAHTIKSHGSVAFGRDLGLILLFDFVVDRVDESNRAQAAELAQLSHALVSTGYSRAAESEADALGLAIAAQAGFKPLGIASALLKIEEYQRSHRDPDQDDVPVYFRTHPLTSDRVRDIYAEAKRLGYPVDGYGDPLLDAIRLYNERTPNQPRIEPGVENP